MQKNLVDGWHSSITDKVMILVLMVYDIDWAIWPTQWFCGPIRYTLRRKRSYVSSFLERCLIVLFGTYNRISDRGSFFTKYGYYSVKRYLTYPSMLWDILLLNICLSKPKILEKHLQCMWGRLIWKSSNLDKSLRENKWVENVSK